LAGRQQPLASTLTTNNLTTNNLPLGGHVAKNLGDGLLIYFGWPTAREDDPERAVRAGLAIVDAMVPLNATLTDADRVSMSPAVLGALAARTRYPLPLTPAPFFLTILWRTA
jgi:hypothetical protein